MLILGCKLNIALDSLLKLSKVLALLPFISNIISLISSIFNQ